MRIAFFNWRDIRHPLAGGAEVVTHRFLSGLARRGHRVTLFTATYPGAAATESIDGVEHVRYGGRYSIYIKARSVYKERIEGRYDMIVESVNGVPFYTSLFADEPVVSFIHQLTRENWYSAFPPYVAWFLDHAEALMLRPYRSLPALAPSESTKEDLVRLGFGRVSVVTPGASVELAGAKRRRKAPTLIYLGRLVRSKRVDDALRVFKAFRGNFPDAQLWVVGTGPDEKRLLSLSRSLGVEDGVVFFGKVDERKKVELLSQASLALCPSTREGWGLVVIEANLCGTPVLGYDVPGLRDSIRDGENGFRLRPGDVEGMAAKAVRIMDDPRYYRSLSERCRRYAGRFGWEGAVERLEDMLEGLS